MTHLANVLDSTAVLRARAMSRVDSPWRASVAAAGLIAAAAHIPVTGEHLQEALYIGVLFILLEIAATVLAVVVLVRPARWAYLAIAVVGALAVLALVVSRTLGMPLIADDIGNWTEPLAVVSFGAELLMIVGGVSAALDRRAPTPRTSRVALLVGLLVLVLGATATGVAAFAEDGGSGDMGGMDMGGMHMGSPAAPEHLVLE